LKTQSAGEQGFDCDAHRLTPPAKEAPWACGQAAKRPAHMPTGQHHQHTLCKPVSTQNDEGPWKSANFARRTSNSGMLNGRNS